LANGLCLCFGLTVGHFCQSHGISPHRIHGCPFYCGDALAQNLESVGPIRVVEPLPLLCAHAQIC
jgi:hypothetical protein